MAGFVNKFKHMWDNPDDYDDYDYSDEYENPDDDAMDDSEEELNNQRDAQTRNKVVNINATAKLQVVLFKPERFGEETRAIADELLKTHTVVLNLENTSKDMSRRIIDFLSGVAYANRGKIKRVATSTFIIIPNNVDLTGDDLLDELENSGVYF